MAEAAGVPRVAVVGGGMTGLACAHRLLELSREAGRPIDLQIFEGSDRLGGVIASERREGFLLEAGPDSFITDKPWALALCDRLGIRERVIGTNETHRRSFVVHAGRLHPVPEGFQLLAPGRLGPFLASGLFTWPGKVRMALEPFIPPRREGGDESLASFVERRLGREALARIAQPMVAGIYGADPRNLSLDATLPRFRTMEREHGSILRAMWARKRDGATGRGGDRAKGSGTSGARYGLFVSFDAGMQTLTDALIARIPPDAVSLATRVTTLQREADGWQIETQSPEPRAQSRLYNAVCLALPAWQAADLLAGSDRDLAGSLRAVPYAAAATVNLAYRRDDIPHPLDGFGFVVPSTEQRTLLGCTFCHVKYPGRAPEGRALLRAFVGEGGLTPLAPLPSEGRGESTSPFALGKGAGGLGPGLVAAVREDLRALLGITVDPLFTTVHCFPAAMAQYAVGHQERIAAIEERLGRFPGLALAGNGYHGIGIPDCVRSGETAAERLWQALPAPI
jgi:oxygen-dependent protoporphyrinogen oxidase